MATVIGVGNSTAGTSQALELSKADLVATIVQRYPDRPIVFSTGYASRLAYGLRPEAANHFYMVGSMGMAAAIARGVSSMVEDHDLAPVVLDGDGSLLMGVHGLLLEKEAPSSPILHLVADDGLYASTGSQAVPPSRQNMCAFAAAAGYPHVECVQGALTDLDSTLRVAEGHLSGGQSVFVRCMVTPGSAPEARVDRGLPVIAATFGNFCHRITSRPNANG